MSLTIRNPIHFAIAFTAAAAVTQTCLLELSKRFAQVEKVGSGDCFQDIVAKYPGMD